MVSFNPVQSVCWEPGENSRGDMQGVTGAVLEVPAQGWRGGPHASSGAIVFWLCDLGP